MDAYVTVPGDVEAVSREGAGRHLRSSAEVMFVVSDIERERHDAGELTVRIMPFSHHFVVVITTKSAGRSLPILDSAIRFVLHATGCHALSLKFDRNMERVTLEEFTRAVVAGDTGYIDSFNAYGQWSLPLRYMGLIVLYNRVRE